MESISKSKLRCALIKVSEKSSFCRALVIHIKYYVFPLFKSVLKGLFKNIHVMH